MTVSEHCGQMFNCELDFWFWRVTSSQRIVRDIVESEHSYGHANTCIHFQIEVERALRVRVVLISAQTPVIVLDVFALRYTA